MESVVKRDFNGAAHFLLGLSMFATIMAIINGFLTISNYNLIGVPINNTQYIEIVIDFLILAAAVFTFLKKPWGLIALTALFIIRMFATVDYSSSLSIAGQLGGKTALLTRDFGLFAIAMCFRKNGISGWKSMLASEEYVLAHTKENRQYAESESQANDLNLESQSVPQGKSDVVTNTSEDVVSEFANINSIASGPIEHQSESQAVPKPSKEENKEKKVRISLLQRMNELSRVGKIGIVSGIGVFVLIAAIFALVSLKSYPSYISSFGDKWKYTFNLPNDRLVKELMEQAQPHRDGLYYVLTYPQYSTNVFDADQFYSRRVDAIREYSGLKVYVTTGELKTAEELKDNAIYVSLENGELSAIESNSEIATRRQYWLDNKSLDGEKIFKTKEYDCETEIAREMSIVDQAASILVKELEPVDLVGGYYENEFNYSKASDYYSFLLKHYSRNADIRGRLAYSLCLGGNNSDAREEAEKALNKNPKQIYALGAMALVEAEEYNWDEAKKYARRAIDYGADISNVYYAYCEALYKQGEIKAAHQYYNKAYESYRHNPRREKYSEYAGCPIEITEFHYGASTNSKITIPKDEKLVSSKCYYIDFYLDINVLRWETIELGIKIYRNGSLSTGSESKDGYTYYATIYGRKPGTGTARISGWGNDNGSFWSAGHHRIEVWYKGEKIAEDTFRVY